MRKITHYLQSLLCAMALFVSVNTTAQNIFPASGAVGLGTTTPQPNFGAGIGLHINRPAFYGGEMFLNCTVDDAPDFMRLTNASGGGNELMPMLLGNKGIRAVGGLSRQALILQGNVDGSHDFSGNLNPVMTFIASKNYVANQILHESITFRPLFSWQNGFQTQMTMLANGYLGIGTTTPSEQLNTNAGVRFEGLPITKTVQKYFVMADANGVLYRVDRSSINLGGSEPISTNTEVSELYQNQPNPFRENTIIKFKIAKNATSKMIIVYDMQGKQLRKIEVVGDAQQVVFEANSLSAGMYLYALIVNGKEVDTKRMIIMD